MANNPTIFVLIASYRDVECQWTVKDLFEKAAHPERVHIGICWQADPITDAACFEIETRPDQVRSIHFLPSESNGLGWARGKAQSLWAGEDYVLQIDSHMRFVADWDKKILAQLEACNSPQPILTVYPPGYTPPNDLQPDPPIRVQCAKTFRTSGILYYTATTLPKGVQVTAPLPTACLAGGFIFGQSKWLQAVAHDPDIYFNGEEHALAVRLWTHGFDLFSPSQTLLYHYYIREEAVRHSSDDPAWHEKHKKTLTRLRQLVAPSTVPERDVIDMGPFGLGHKRSLAEYEAWSGVNFSTRSIAPFAQVFPYVRTDDVAAVLNADRDITVSDQAELFIVDNEGLLFSAIQGDIYHLNPAATWVWCALEEGADWNELVSGLSQVSDLDIDEAERAIVNLVAHWHGMRVLEGDEIDEDDSDLAPDHDEENTEADSLLTKLPTGIEYHKQQHYKILDTSFRIQFQTPEHADWLMPSLVHLESDPESTPDHTIVIHGTGDNNAIHCDEKLVADEKSVSQLATYLKNQLVLRALENTDYVLALHAGIVEKNDAVIAFPGASGDGKSTLVAGLLRNGFRYYSDELAPMHSKSGEIIPVPLSLCVKEAGFPVLLNLYPELNDHHLHDRDDGRRAAYIPPPLESMVQTHEAQRITHIVFPRYQEGVETILTPVTNVSAFGRLMEQCISLPTQMTLPDAAMLVDWIESVKCYEMLTGSLESSIASIESIVPGK